MRKAERIILDTDLPTGYVWVKVIKRFQFAVSYLYYFVGDLTSRTPWFCWDPWSWKVYQFCMQESVKLDVDCKIWKDVEPKAITKARRRKVSKRGPRGVD